MICIDKQMPTNCYDCWIRQNMGCRIANESGWLNDRRDDKCPLKAQEPVKPIENAGFYYCGACRYAFTSTRQKYCSDCGRAVKWDG